MKDTLMVLLLALLGIILAAWIQGCASVPTQKTPCITYLQSMCIQNICQNYFVCS